MTGRKKKKEIDLRNRKIFIRLTLSEYEQLILLCNGIKVSDFVRKALLDSGGIDSSEALGLIKILGGNLGKVGSNINQIAKHANSAKDIKSDELARFNDLLSNFNILTTQIEFQLRALLKR